MANEKNKRIAYVPSLASLELICALMSLVPLASNCKAHYIFFRVFIILAVFVVRTAFFSFLLLELVVLSLASFKRSPQLYFFYFFLNCK